MAGTAAAHDHDHVVSGILCRIGSGFSFATMGALLKLASEQGLNAPELVFYRSLFSLPVVLFWVLKRESLAALRPNRPLAHVWRSGLGLLSMGLTFQALILLPLADATAINFTAPIFATILSFLILREFVGVHRWAAVFVGFIGVLIVARPGGSSLPLLGVGIALAGALGQAGVTTTLRHLQRSETCRRHRLLVRDLGRAGRRSPDARLRAAPWPGSDGPSTRGGPGRRSGAVAHDVIAARARVGRFPLRLSSDRRGHRLTDGCSSPTFRARTRLPAPRSLPAVASTRRGASIAAGCGKRLPQSLPSEQQGVYGLFTTIR